MLTVLTNNKSTKVLWLVEDNLQWKTTFGGRRPSEEDDLRWKTTFGGRRPSGEDDLGWKTTFSGRQHSLEDNLWWIIACCLAALRHFFPYGLVNKQLIEKVKQIKICKSLLVL